jgi:hypothetical protein
VREGGAPKSQGVSGVCVSVAMRESLQDLGELCDRVIVQCFLPDRVLRMVHACSFYSLKEVQGYKMLCGRSLPGKQLRGLGRPYPVASWSVL